jgi:hypothetical protein
MQAAGGQQNLATQGRSKDQEENSMLPQPEQEDQGIANFSREALQVIESWDDDRQKRFSRELQRWYGWSVRFLLQTATQTYLHVNDFKAMQLLTRETCLVIIDGVTCHIKLDHSRLCFAIVRIDERRPQDWCQIHSVT